MRQLSVLIVFFFCLLSCKTKNDKVVTTGTFQFLMADTANNFRAQWDLRDFNFCSKLENQIGLKEIKDGADSLEIRLWYDFSFSNSKELYILNFQDTGCLLSYYRIYPRQINYDDENRNREWNPYADPIIDSFVSKSALLSIGDAKDLHIDSIWFLKSQSELKISDSIGFTDCDSYTLEIADKNRFKYLRHHCAMGYYNKTKLADILNYMDFCGRIISLATKFDAVVPNKYN